MLNVYRISEASEQSTLLSRIFQNFKLMVKISAILALGESVNGKISNNARCPPNASQEIFYYLSNKVERIKERKH